MQYCEKIKLNGRNEITKLNEKEKEGGLVNKTKGDQNWFEVAVSTMGCLPWSA